MVPHSGREGQQLGNYRLLRLLGHGGFADVYLGQHIHLGTQAAIKVLQAHMTQQDVQNFTNEAKTISKLRHPHIVRLLDFGIENTTVFLVMDYASQGTLRNRHPRGSLIPLPIVVQYVNQIASALQYAHDRGLVHRDIKPENMLVDSHDTILLSDFGIAIPAHKTQSLSTQEAIGTVFYMAPEQIKGKARSASDQYSLGAVVYEWLSGKRPFEGLTSIEIAMKHLTEQPAPLCQKLPLLSSSVEDVLWRALAKEPKDRFVSVQTFAKALEQASQRKPTIVSSSAPTQAQPYSNIDSTTLKRKASSEDIPPKVLPSQKRAPDTYSTQVPSTPPFISSPTVSPQTARNYSKKRSNIRNTIITGIILLTVGIVLFTYLPQWLQSFSSSPSCSSAFSGTFRDPLDSRWNWIDPQQDTQYRITNQNQLEISVSNAYRDLHPGSNYYAPRLLQPIAGDFTIETRVHFTPNASYEGAGLLIWQNANTHVRLERSYGHFSGLEFDQNDGAPSKLSSVFNDINPGPKTTATIVDLRLQRRGDIITAWWRDIYANEEWQRLAGSATVQFTSVRVGLVLAVQQHLVSTVSLPVTAQYDYFKVTCP